MPGALCISAYCLPCCSGDDIIAHDRQTMERIPTLFKDQEIEGVMKDRVREEKEMRKDETEASSEMRIKKLY